MRYFLLIYILFTISLFAQSQNIHQKIDKKQDEIERIDEQEKSLTGRLDKTLKHIAALKTEIKDLQSNLAIMDAEKDSIENEIAKTEKDLDKALQTQADIVKNLYISRKTPEIAIVFKDNFNDLPRKNAYLSAIANYREKNITNTKLLISELKKQKSLQAELIKDEEKAISARKQSLNELEKLTESQEKILASLKRKKTEYLDALATLQAQAKNLRKLSHGDMPVNGSFPSKIPWPIDSRDIIHSFGMTKDSEFGTEFYNPGIDIRAIANDQVRAVTDGIVAHVGWLRGYGNIVIIKHPQDYYTLYGNLETTTVHKDMRVQGGMVIGDVSPYGWLEGAKLHFELRKGKKEQNPLNWLSDSAVF